MNRITLAEMIDRQQVLHEKQRAENERLAGMLSAALGALAAALEALTERRHPTQSVTVKRTGTGSNPTVHEVNAVTLDGESLHDAAERARLEYELLAARFPLPSGQAHAAELGPWPGAE